MISIFDPRTLVSWITLEARHQIQPAGRFGSQLAGIVGATSSSATCSQLQNLEVPSACQNNPRAYRISSRPSRLLTSRIKTGPKIAPRVAKRFELGSWGRFLADHNLSRS